jgi:histidyl-tRNA synthetase
VAENFDALPKPYRSYREGFVFRNEKPGPGRFRQFMQFDADTVGSASMAADAEMCMMAADTMEALGIPRGSYVVKVSNRKVLEGLLEVMGLGSDEHATTRLTVLRAIDKLDRLGVQAVSRLLGEGRKDESGDFTKGANLPPSVITKIVDFLTGEGETWADTTKWKTPTDDEWIITGPEIEKRTKLAADPKGKFFYSNSHLLSHWREIISESEIGGEGISELRQTLVLMESAGYGSRRFRISAQTIRGLEYYTGPVYELDLTFETKDEHDRPARFGSVGGGGRYDGLIARFRGEPVPATGFSIGVSRLAAALQHLGKIESRAEPGPVVVTVFDRERVADYQNMVATLRNAGIRAELYLGSGKMGPQLKYADKRGAPCVVIQGGDEKAKGEVQIKDLIEGAKAAAAIASNQEWRASRPAQFAVPQDKLVDAVREVLARHEVKWS